MWYTMKTWIVIIENKCRNQKRILKYFKDWLKESILFVLNSTIYFIKKIAKSYVGETDNTI